jgi:DNA-binding response OmpR family regulator
MNKEKSYKILIVEDDEISRNIYRLMLKKFDMAFCDSDETMYKELSEDNFQLIIMDIGLPNSKDGLTLIKQLKGSEQYYKIPIICATSYDSHEIKANAIKAGADVYLVKPILKDILINTINKFQTIVL